MKRVYESTGDVGPPQHLGGMLFYGAGASTSFVGQYYTDNLCLA